MNRYKFSCNSILNVFLSFFVFVFFFAIFPVVGKRFVSDDSEEDGDSNGSDDDMMTTMIKMMEMTMAVMVTMIMIDCFALTVICQYIWLTDLIMS